MILLLLCVASWAILVTGETDKPYYNIEEAEELFEDFIKTHGSVYSDETEKQLRFNIFKENLKIINQKNSMGGAVFAINKFADLTVEEFRSHYMGLKPSSFIASGAKCKVVNENDIVTNDAPASVDWVKNKKVTKVKDQDVCGSCWAFAVIANIESQYAIKTGKLLLLSEQELVDCSDNNLGCFGGLEVDAMQDLIDIGGVQLDSDYPYVAANQACVFNETQIVVKLKGCSRYNITDEEKLKEIVAKNGPVAVGIYADCLKWYGGGIFTPRECPRGPSNHAVLVVGYGTDNGTDYWVIKNSWGTKFGERGYFRITRGDDTCGIMYSNSASVEL